MLPFEAPADADYGAIRAALELAGTPIGGNDLLIAAHAKALGATIVTANTGEFKRVGGVKVENWLGWGACCAAPLSGVMFAEAEAHHFVNDTKHRI